MLVDNLLRQVLQIPCEDLGHWIPAEKISRQDWQEAVERMIRKIRLEFRQPAFGVSAAEISIHYHLALPAFADHVGRKIGVAD